MMSNWKYDNHLLYDAFDIILQQLIEILMNEIMSDVIEKVILKINFLID